MTLIVYLLEGKGSISGSPHPYIIFHYRKTVKPLTMYYPGHSKWAFRECFVRLKNVLERSKNNSESLFFFCYVPETLPEHVGTFRNISERLFYFRNFHGRLTLSVQGSILNHTVMHFRGRFTVNFCRTFVLNLK
jgi:hypothetical protein